MTGIEMAILHSLHPLLKTYKFYLGDCKDRNTQRTWIDFIEAEMYSCFKRDLETADLETVLLPVSAQNSLLVLKVKETISHENQHQAHQKAKTFLEVWMVHHPCGIPGRKGSHGVYAPKKPCEPPSHDGHSHRHVQKTIGASIALTERDTTTWVVSGMDFEPKRHDK